MGRWSAGRPREPALSEDEGRFPFWAFFFCPTLTLAYPLSVKLSVIGKVSVGKARVGTAATGRPSRANRGPRRARRWFDGKGKFGRLLARGVWSPA
jgi:hypothetical protein